MYKLISVFFLYILVSYSYCDSDKTTESRPTFKFPKIINSYYSDTVKASFFQAEHVEEGYPFWAGKYAFQDTIDLNFEKRDTSIYKNSWVYPIWRLSPEDTLDVNGFEVFVDYETTVPYDFRGEKHPRYFYYPVYFVNTSSTNKLFIGRGNAAYGIQEATDSYHWKWHPIEHRFQIYCGAGDTGLIVRPNEFVVILMMKYEGHIETTMRVRFEVGQSIYVSKPFWGCVNPEQFTLTEAHRNDIKWMQSAGNGSSSTWLFHGATPKMKE